MKTPWNKHYEPISTRLRDDNEIQSLVENNAMMYNPNTENTAIIVEVFKVSYEENEPDEDWESEEDRWVEYITPDGPREDFSVDLDDEGWLWHDGLQKENK